MIRRSLFWCALLVPYALASQNTPPSDLFNSDLRDWLKTNWYDCQFSDLGYVTAREQMYSFSDEVGGNINCVYTHFEQVSSVTTFPDPINAEHLVPQSFYGSISPMKSDIHNLRPCHGSANSARSNNPFGEVDDVQATWYGVDEFGNYYSTTTEPTPSGQFSERHAGVWEPNESKKGDVARQVFYFYTMYPNVAGPIENIGDVQLLYQWHLDDPVDANEMIRNDRIESAQGNRNPYIDYQELVYQAWFELALLGCTDENACNYDELANVDDGSCEEVSCAGCTYSLASNYDPFVTKDDGSCDFSNLAQPSCQEDINEDLIINVADLLQLLGAFGEFCP